MAEEKKLKEAEVTEKKAAKAQKPAKKKDDRKFSEKFKDFFKKIWAAIKRFFKDLRGETKKIVWPSRQMVIKSTGVVLAAIIIIGAGIWIIDFALSGAVSAVNKAAKAETTTEAVSEEAKTDDMVIEQMPEDDDAEAETTAAAEEKEPASEAKD